MNNAIRFSGRALYLSQNPECIRRQLDGEDLTLASAEPLRDNISTDEITPVTVMMVYDKRLWDGVFQGSCRVNRVFMPHVAAVDASVPD